MADKKKSKSVQINSYYKIEGNSVKRLKRECLKCGKGVFMAEHKDRLTCGKCGYTEFSKKQK